MSAVLTGFQQVMWLQLVAVQCCSIFSMSPVLLLGLSMQTAARALALTEGELYGACRSDGGCNSVALYCYGASYTCQECDVMSCERFHDIWSACRTSSACRGVVEPPESSSSFPKVPTSKPTTMTLTKTSRSSEYGSLTNLNYNQQEGVKVPSDDGSLHNTVWVLLIALLFLVVVIVVVVILAAMFFGKDLSRRLRPEYQKPPEPGDIRRLVHTNSVSSQTDSEASSEGSASLERSVQVSIEDETLPLKVG